MVTIGNKYKEKMPSWVGNGHCFFSYIYTVNSFKHESFGEFAECVRTYKNGKEEPVSISIELLEDETFFKQIA